MICSAVRSTSSKRLPSSAGALPGALSAHPGRRVPGHQPRAVRPRVGAGRASIATCSWSETPTSRSTAGGRRISATSSISRRTIPTPGKSTSRLNYRSTARIVEAADRVIRENVSRIDRRLRTDNPDGEHINLRELSDQAHEAQFIADEIVRLANLHGVAYDDVAIMYRTTAQSRAIEESLRARGIPYQVIGGVRFYERKEIKDVLAVLRLLHNPADTVGPGTGDRQPANRPGSGPPRPGIDPILGGCRTTHHAGRLPGAGWRG